MMRAGLWLPGYFASSNPMHLSDPTASSVRKTPYPLAQHTFGLDYPALHRQKNPILVFRLLPGFLLEHPTHNRQLEGLGGAGKPFWVLTS